MNDAPQEAWFYTREGEQIGPITIADLRIKAKEGELNPRLDMVWSRGMDTWLPSGEIEGLFERRTAAESQESLAPAAGSFTPPPQETAAERMGRENGWPGARRRGYLIISILFPALWVLGYPSAFAFLEKQFGTHITQFAAPAIGLIPALVLIYFNLNRFLNLGMCRWWILGFAVPILQFWVGFRCFACPGGYAYHKKLDGPGILLAVIYWLLVASLFVACGLATAIYLGLMGSAELQEQVRETLRQAVSGTAPES